MRFLIVITNLVARIWTSRISGSSQCSLCLLLLSALVWVLWKLQCSNFKTVKIVSKFTYLGSDVDYNGWIIDRGAKSTSSLSSPCFPSLSFPLFSSPFLLRCPLCPFLYAAKLNPKIQQGVWGNAVNYPRKVWSRALVAIAISVYIFWAGETCLVERFWFLCEPKCCNWSESNLVHFPGGGASVPSCPCLWAPCRGTAAPLNRPHSAISSLIR